MTTLIKKQGSTIKFLYKQTTDAGEPENFTGGSLSLIIKRSEFDLDEDAVHSENKTIFDAPVTGKQYFTINAEQSAELSPMTYFCEIKYVSATGLTDYSEIFNLVIKETLHTQS